MAKLTDAAYQLIELKSFYAFEVMIGALVLAFLPCELLRGPIAPFARWWGIDGEAGRAG